MSYKKYRSANNCLNCNAVVQGKFCHVCGQENIEPAESFIHIIQHFVYDITHFDGKFFYTLKYLIFKPGFLSKEYLKGRRNSYLNPIKMYVFTSAIFFLISFGIYNKEENQLISNNTKEQSKLDSAQVLIDSIANAKRDSTKPQFVFNGDTINASTIKQYDSLQAILPSEKKDNFLKQYYIRRGLTVNENLKSKNKSFWEDTNEKLIHQLPKMMFVLLPLLALVLKLLYSRNKQLLYVHHAIFIVHLFIGIYILWMINFGIALLYKQTHYAFFSWLNSAFIIANAFFQYKSFRYFYNQSRLKTIIKYGIFLLLSFLLIIILMLLIWFNGISTN